MTNIGFKDERTPRKLRKMVESGATSLPGQSGLLQPVGAPQHFRNTSSETAPAWGVLRVTNVVEYLDRYVFDITKPDDTPGLFVFNSGHDVDGLDGLSYSVGVCFGGPIVKALYDTGTPTNGEVLGVDGWTLSASGESVLSVNVFGVADATEKTLLAQLQTGGGSGFIVARVDEVFLSTDLSADGTVLETFGTISEGPGDQIRLFNTVQAWDGVIGDYCIAKPRPGTGGTLPAYEIDTKPCFPNGLNDTDIVTDPVINI